MHTFIERFLIHIGIIVLVAIIPFVEIDDAPSTTNPSDHYSVNISVSVGGLAFSVATATDIVVELDAYAGISVEGEGVLSRYLQDQRSRNDEDRAGLHSWYPERGVS